MLLEFSVKNFKSFKDEVTLSFEPGSCVNFPERVLGHNGSKYRALRSSIVYGANGAGKTTLMDAARFMKTFILNSPNTNETSKLALPCFAFDEKSRKSPVFFQIVFVKNDDRYEYSFSFLPKGIVSEVLRVYPQNGRERTLLNRDTNGIKLGRYLSKGSGFKKEYEKLQNNQLLIAAPTKCVEFAYVRDFIKSFKFIYNADQLLEMTNQMIHDNTDNNSLVEYINEFLSNIDKCIESVHVTRVTPEEAEQRYRNLPDEIREQFVQKHRDDGVFDVYFKHLGSRALIPIQKESKGTQRLYSMLGLLFAGIIESSVVFIDELNSSLHPAVAEYLMQFIHEQEDIFEGYQNLQSQFVMNLHDTTLLNPSLIRRDQVWFVGKDDNGSSELYSLSEFKDRSTTFQRNYLDGKYGAIPIIKRFGLHER